MNDKQNKTRVSVSELPISEHAELIEKSIKDLELRMLREIKQGAITHPEFAKKVGYYKTHICTWAKGTTKFGIKKIIEMGKRYK